ncbi:MAG TPA: hypothetical protein VF603_09305 [Allosphingosinicella sp.]|jgi:hypothetical protein
MIAALILAGFGVAAEPPLPPELQAYYFCVANRADSLVEDEPARAPAQIAASAIGACAPLRATAVSATVRLMLADPAVRGWARERQMSEEELMRSGEIEFDAALHERLLRNIAELRAAAGARE